LALLSSGSSLVLDLLRFLRDNVRNRPLTLDEIREGILETHPWEWRRADSFLFSPINDIDTRTFIENALNSLEELGLVSGSVEFEESSGIPRWQIADSWQPPAPPDDGDDGRGGDDRQPPPPGEDGGDDDDGGGGGIREALSHPILFSLDKDEFNGLLENLFDEGR